MNADALSKDALTKYAQENREGFEALLKEFVEIPTVSVDATKKDAVSELAHKAAETIHRFGGEAEIIATPGNPLVHGRWGNDPSRPSVTLYNHLDVQPASKETEPWETEPFVFTKKGDRYFGRGTTDDKGPALSALFGVTAAVDAGVPVNVRFLWEFEEEIGSPSFLKGITSAKEKLATDSIIVSDTIWIA